MAHTELGEAEGAQEHFRSINLRQYFRGEGGAIGNT